MNQYIGKLLSLLGVMLFFSSSLHSQSQATGDKPVIHVVSFPMGDASWLVTYPSHAPLPPNPNAPEIPSGNAGVKWKIEIVRKEGLRRDLVWFADGSSVNYWWPREPAVVLWKERGGDVRVMRGGYFQDQRLDHTAFDWVNEKTLIDMQTMNGVLSRHYRMEYRDAAGELIVYQAWIDNESNRPVALEIGETRGIFAFRPTVPEEPLVMNADYERALAQSVAAMRPRKSLGR